MNVDSFGVGDMTTRRAEVEMNIDIWDLCQLCALHFTECVCFSVDSDNPVLNPTPLKPNTNYSDLPVGIGFGSDSIMSHDQSILGEFDFTWETYQKSYTPAPQPLSSGYWNQDFCPPSVEHAFVSDSQHAKEGQAMAEERRNSKATRTHTANTKAPSRKSSSSSPRAEDGINTQRKISTPKSSSSPRDVASKQSQLIHTLRQKVEELQEEHEKLTMVLEEKMARISVPVREEHLPTSDPMPVFNWDLHGWDVSCDFRAVNVTGAGGLRCDVGEVVRDRSVDLEWGVLH